MTAKDQFMAGWWTSKLNELGARVWKLTEKTEIEKCVLDTDCSAGERCAWWPDQNNKRC